MEQPIAQFLVPIRKISQHRKNPIFNLLNEKRTADVLFKFPNDEEVLYAHKAILAANSKIFEDMFYNEQRPEDEQIDVVNILNRNRNIYKQLFEYFYTGETFVAIVDALDLMEEFHTHDIPTQSLEDYVRDYLNIDMFADAFATAVALNLNLLKDNTGLFIDNANAREIFAKFNYLRLPEMTIKELFVDYCRELAFDGIIKWAIYQVTQIIPKKYRIAFY